MGEIDRQPVQPRWTKLSRESAFSLWVCLAASASVIALSLGSSALLKMGSKMHVIFGMGISFWMVCSAWSLILAWRGGRDGSSRWPFFSNLSLVGGMSSLGVNAYKDCFKPASQRFDTDFGTFISIVGGLVGLCAVIKAAILTGEQRKE